MAKETLTAPRPKAQGGKWFKKIPKEVLFSPGGIILLFVAAAIELIDVIPIPVIDQIWELPLEIGFLVLLAYVIKMPWQSMILPFILERIPGLSDIIPTWFIRLFL